MGKEFTFVEHEKPYKYKEGDLTVTRGSAWSAPGCHLGCSVLMYTNDEGKLVKVEGDPESPYSNGRLCVRCLNLMEAVYHPDRVLYPMKRDPKDRGTDKWERITWDEAYDLIESEFTRIKDTYGAETVAFMQGTGRDIAAWISRLAWSYGTPNYTGYFSGQSCYAPRICSLFATTGSFWVSDSSQQFADRYDNEEYRVPETIFVWGNYPLISNSDGYYGHWVIDLMKRGTKVVMIDPKVTWLSARSVEHLRVRPGTDAALALGMLNVIITEDLYDHEFVDKWCYGFEEFTERVLEYPAEKMAEVTWVPLEKIQNAARLLAKSNNASLQWGVAVDMTKEAVPAAQAILSLFEITGNLDVPGGVIPPPEILNYAGGWGHELMSEEQANKRIGLNDYKLMRFGFQMAQNDSFVRTMETDEPYRMRGLWAQTTNFLSCCSADPKHAQALSEKLEFIVYVDLFMTPTAVALADVFLPACTFAERNGIRVGDGVQRAEIINKVIEPLGETKSDMQINLEMGKRFNPEAWPWDNVEDMFSEILKVTGMDFYELREKAPAYLPFEYKRYEKGLMRPDGQPGFNTASGRIELWSSFINNAELDPMPYFEEPSPGPIATPELLEEYPLVLTTGARLWGFFHSEHRQIPRMRHLHPDPIVEINPKVLERYGIKDGDWIWIENEKDRAKRRVVATPVLDERIISCDHAWWLPEASPENLYDLYDYAINNLIPFHKNGRSGFGANYKTTLVKIYKVEEGE